MHVGVFRFVFITFSINNLWFLGLHAKTFERRCLMPANEVKP